MRTGAVILSNHLGTVARLASELNQTARFSLAADAVPATWIRSLAACVGDCTKRPWPPPGVSL